MAERIIRQLIDDLDQTEIPDGKGGTVEFSLRGTNYKIDLTDSNIAKLDKALAPFVEAATRASSPGASTSRSAAAPSRKKRSGRRPSKRGGGVASTKTVRAWAAENGHEINSRGRIPAAVTQAYESAQGSAT